MRKWMGLGLVVLCFGVGWAEDILVSLTPSNGVLSVTGMEPGTACAVEWVSDLQKTFTNESDSIHFDDLVVDDEGDASMAIPMFFRIKGTLRSTTPKGMVAIPAGTNSGTNFLGDGESYGSTYPETYSLTVDDFWMGEAEVTNDEMAQVLQWAYDQGKLSVSSTHVQNAQGDPQELLALDESFCQVTWDGSAFGLTSATVAEYPCLAVSWYGAIAYCNYRSELEGQVLCYDLSDWSVNLTADGYRLPTSEEWEYAARGGLIEKRFPWGDTINHDNANYSANGDAFSYDTSPYENYTYHPDYSSGYFPHTSPVRDLSMNGYGLFGMAGNVFEWCDDRSGSKRVIRGGSWSYYADSARCGNARLDDPYRTYNRYGFRAIFVGNELFLE